MALSRGPVAKGGNWERGLNTVTVIYQSKMKE